ncbi:MAG: hypothetical protein JNK05_35020 [Myxococcales bacterium]|nr:hypothetical protein [Myxococcales bacterium]
MSNNSIGCARPVIAALFALFLANCAAIGPLEACPSGNECRGGTSCTTVATSTTRGASGRMCTVSCTTQNNPCGPHNICVTDAAGRGVCHQQCDGAPCPAGTACAEVALGIRVCAPAPSP